MQYWLNLFTGTTWQESKASGAQTTGFRNRMRNTVARVKPGDILLCYITGIMRWVGALEVIGPSDDDSKIWSIADFPSRLTVKPIIMLEPENGIPMSKLEGHVEFYEGPSDKGKFKGFVRRSPNLFKCEKDGEYIVNLLKQAQVNPVSRPVDPKKFARKPLLVAEGKKGKKAIKTLVSIPDTEADEIESLSSENSTKSADTITPHSNIQYKLLKLGVDMGLEVWVARNDRSKTYNGIALGDMPGTVDELPTQFNEATNKTIELIDLLWLKGNSIIAAFEIECTTAIYSGLLR